MIDIERSDRPTHLEISPGSLSGLTVGEVISLSVIAAFSDGALSDITQSTRLKANSQNLQVVTVKSGVMTAVSPGKTVLDVQYGPTTQVINVSVAAAH